MFWDKKEKSLPDLPQPRNPVANLPQFPQEENYKQEEFHQLPSFPDSPMKRGFSQAAIKDAVNERRTPEIRDFGQNDTDSRIPAFREIPEESESQNQKFRLTEMEEWSPNNSIHNSMPRDFEEDFEEPVISKRRTSEPKSIFVKIDKFKVARDSIMKVESGLQEIEDLLNHIREVKAKEDQELSAWEKDLENIKSRINNVITDIFDRTEA